MTKPTDQNSRGGLIRRQMLKASAGTSALSGLDRRTFLAAGTVAAAFALTSGRARAAALKELRAGIDGMAAEFGAQ